MILCTSRRTGHLRDSRSFTIRLRRFQPGGGRWGDDLEATLLLALLSEQVSDIQQCHPPEDENAGYGEGASEESKNKPNWHSWIAPLLGGSVEMELRYTFHLPMSTGFCLSDLTPRYH
jgi:hypothetical protein